MFQWMKEIIDGIKWARARMLAQRETDAFESKIARFLTGDVWPASLKYKKAHGHKPKYLLLPMERLADVHRIMGQREYRVIEKDGKYDNKMFDIEVAWNGEEGEEGWSFSDECPYEDE